MPKYAYFDSTQPSPQRVIGWYDTDTLTYANLPGSADLFLLTNDQWAGRLTSDPSLWMIDEGTLTAYVPPTPPSPTLAQQAQTLLATGMPLESFSTPALNGTYPCTAAAQANEMGMLTAITAGLTLPGGVAVVLDTTGAAHAFTPVKFKTYCQVKLNFTQTLNTIIGSNSGTLPTVPVALD